jgi:hypothetical protein
MNILIVIPFTAEQAEQAERLCDYIYHLADRNQGKSCLLIPAADVHPEMRLKVRLAAEVAFEQVNLYATKGATIDEAAKYVASNYKSPWLWLEPDCVPLEKGWSFELAQAYDSQPKKFMGAYCKNGDSSMYLARQSVYPAQIESARTGDIEVYSTKCRLIQIGKYDGMDKIRPDAVLFCSDPTGKLMADLQKLKGK